MRRRRRSRPPRRTCPGPAPPARGTPRRRPARRPGPLRRRSRPLQRGLRLVPARGQRAGQVLAGRGEEGVRVASFGVRRGVDHDVGVGGQRARLLDVQVALGRAGRLAGGARTVVHVVDRDPVRVGLHAQHVVPEVVRGARVEARQRDDAERLALAGEAEAVQRAQVVGPGEVGGRQVAGVGGGRRDGVRRGHALRRVDQVIGERRVVGQPEDGQHAGSDGGGQVRVLDGAMHLLGRDGRQAALRGHRRHLVLLLLDRQRAVEFRRGAARRHVEVVGVDAGGDAVLVEVGLQGRDRAGGLAVAAGELVHGQVGGPALLDGRFQAEEVTPAQDERDDLRGGGRRAGQHGRVLQHDRPETLRHGHLTRRRRRRRGRER